MLLEIAALSVSFGKQDVLRRISIDIPTGQTLVILGESGCGKTVLLKTMIGLVRPSEGGVRLEGSSLAHMSEADLGHMRTRYGFVFQGAALFDSLTIADNVAFPLREHTLLKEPEIREIVSALLTEVGLPGSVGQKSLCNSPGACASESAWLVPLPSIRIWCCTTSQPQDSIRS